ALEDRLKDGSETGDSMKKRLAPFIDAINQIEGLKATVVQDGAGRDIYRASVKVLERSAKDVIAALKEENPAIYTREYQANNGIIEFDIRAVNEQELEKIVCRLQKIME
ncbi:SelA-like pyridoxal phosphate-dependent enzyme, partial [Enterococcus dongliensis]|nr:SelA-like pyridoxal phosphate-dependent enzyme [Enterococcus dongliensis]